MAKPWVHLAYFWSLCYLPTRLFSVILKKDRVTGYMTGYWKISLQSTSLYRFLSVYGGAFFLFVFRAKNSPVLFKNFLLAYVLLSISRILMIFLFPLEPPAGLIELKDPVISLFIGPKFIEKDLFFSGHTSTIFLLYLCFENKTDKWIAAGLALLTGVLLIIQHVHYTIDIAAAPLFAYICYRLTRGFGLKP
jgi:hypothetical protein